MGTECIGSRLDDSGTIPSVPPGFGPLTTFTLQRVRENALASARTSNFMDSEGNTSDEGRLKKSLRHRPWVNYSQFDNSSEEEESDSELPEPDAPAIQCLPKGVIRGCSECANCQKVTARWRPEDACRPVLDEAPVFYPTEEEFKDTMKYIASIRPRAEPYGICRIVPPSSWSPPCPLKEKDAWENSKFPTRIQKVHMLQNRDSVKKICRYVSMMRRKRRKLSNTLAECKNAYGNIVETNILGSERFGFEPGPNFTLESFKKYANDFKEQYFQKKDDEGLATGYLEPLPENIEGEYWRIVEHPTEEIEVLYGADLETQDFGSGFPKAASIEHDSDLEDHYVKSGWNLNNLPRLPGSVLSFESGDISGVLVPWLYIGMCFSSFCWHVEDHHLYSLNYLHWGDPKIWYGIPGRDALKLEAAMKKHLAELFEEQPDLLHNLVTQFSPSLLKREGVPVYRCLQREGEFVLTFPRAYHSGFNCGFNCAEAVNVAPIDWLPHGQYAVELYREQARKITISHDKLLLGAAGAAVQAQWNISFLGRNTIDNLRWKDACGVNGILAKSLEDRVEMERLRKETLGSSKSMKMDAGFNVNCERECVVCHYDLHLSAVGCPCSPDRFACLIHAKELCPCDWSTRLFLSRYEISELNTLVDALGGKLSAIHRWGLSELGLSLSSVVSKEKTPETKLSLQKTLVSKQSSYKITPLETTNQKDKANFFSGPKSSSTYQEIKASMLQQSSFKVQERQSTTVSSNKPSQAGDGINMGTSDGHTSGQQKPIVGNSGENTPTRKGVILLGDDENEIPQASTSYEVNQEPIVESTQSLARLKSIDKMTNCDSQHERVLVTAEPNASIIREIDGILQHAMEKTGPNMQKKPHCEDIIRGSIAKEISDFLASKQEDETKENGSSSACQPTDAGGLGTISPSFLASLDKYNHLQRGPRMAKVVRRINCNVEPLEYGAVLPGKLWSTSQAIFPKDITTMQAASPRDPTVLYMQDRHISRHCVEPSQVLDCVGYFKKVQFFDVGHLRFRTLLRRAGFLEYSRLSYIRRDRALITALVERWRPETNTFHLRVGEATITLQDVAVLLGLRIDGPPVVGSTGHDYVDLSVRLLGREPPVNLKRKGTVTLSWLREQFPAPPPADATEVEMEQYVRAYILHQIGCSLFPDTNRNLVHLRWLTLLEDIDQCGQYSWGSAVLAFLYSELTDAALGNKLIGGCLTLLLAWSWTRIAVSRPTLSPPVYDAVSPYGHRYNAVKTWYKSPAHALSFYRGQFDSLAAQAFIWQPYTDDLLDELPVMCRDGRPMWRARVPMICWHIVQLHLPDRVLRQFGLSQHIPEAPDRIERHNPRGRAAVDWRQVLSSQITKWEHRLDHVVQERLPRTKPNAYLKWYKGITRRYILQRYVPAFTYTPEAPYVRDMFETLVDVEFFAEGARYDDGVREGIELIIIRVNRFFTSYSRDPAQAPPPGPPEHAEHAMVANEADEAEGSGAHGADEAEGSGAHGLL